MFRLSIILTAALGACAAVFLMSAADPSPQFEYDIRRNVTYSTVEGRDLALDGYVPAGDGPFAAVLVVHGGGWKQGDRHQLARYAKALAARGFVCFAIDYRLAPEHLFPAQIDDCRSAVAWIRAHAHEYKVDPQRLGAVGYSAGGHLVSLLATTGEAPSVENGNVDTRLQAVVAGGAPTDFRSFPEDNGAWAVYLMGGDLDAVPDKFMAASSPAFVDKDDPPVFFFNSNTDAVVPIEWSVPCYEALKEAGVRTEMHRIEKASHMQAMFDSKALDKAWAFLHAELQRTEDTSAAGR